MKLAENWLWVLWYLSLWDLFNVVDYFVGKRSGVQWMLASRLALRLGSGQVLGPVSSSVIRLVVIV